tara:strand:+ start:1587 stop:2018 length:432 start_codon:yes stop_codon:yes gene_type:complete
MDIICDNIEHKKILDKYIQNIKALVYYVTEEEDMGKFNDFNEVLSMIISYSNEFRVDHLNFIKHDGEIDEAAMLEWRYMIPNLVVFSAVGFLAGISNKENRDNFKKIRQKLFKKTSEIIGETYDVYAEDRLTNEFTVKIDEKW